MQLDLKQEKAAEHRTWIVIGAGLCGLAACQELEKRGHSCRLLEEQSVIGGKLKTEVFENNYLLDAGFQVLLPAYSELRSGVDLNSLDLRYFDAGSLIRIGKNWVNDKLMQ